MNDGPWMEAQMILALNLPFILSPKEKEPRHIFETLRSLASSSFELQLKSHLNSIAKSFNDNFGYENSEKRLNYRVRYHLLST